MRDSSEQEEALRSVLMESNCPRVTKVCALGNGHVAARDCHAEPFTDESAASPSLLRLSFYL